MTSIPGSDGLAKFLRCIGGGPGGCFGRMRHGGGLGFAHSLRKQNPKSTRSGNEHVRVSMFGSLFCSHFCTSVGSLRGKLWGRLLVHLRGQLWGQRWNQLESPLRSALETAVLNVTVRRTLDFEFG